MRIIAALLIAMSFLTAPVAAQEDDKGFIAKLLEDSLAGEGRTVQINGFRGALSRKATVQSIVILDEEGPWLRMDNLALQLNRRALLSGRVEIEELSAETIDLSRLPIAPESELPPAEAQGFSLPELPVSIDIKLLKADTIILGTPILGEKAELKLESALSLVAGKALVKLTAERTDSKRGLFEIDAGFQNQDQIVKLDILLDEGEGGIAARLLGLPGNPSTNLTISGAGPLNDLDTNIEIATDGVERLAGRVQLTANAPAAESTTVSRSFKANIGGDITTLFAPQYRPFFGDSISLTAEGTRSADGALDLSAIDLTTEALRLNGRVALNRDYWPTSLDLAGDISNSVGTPVTLPISGPVTKVRAAVLDIQFDHDQGNAWDGEFVITDLERDGLEIESTLLTASGILDGKVNAIGSVSAALDLTVAGISMGNKALSEAVGDIITGQLKIAFVEDRPLKLTELKISGVDFSVSGDAEISELSSGLETTFETRLIAEDISRFSGLAGNKLNGAVAIDLNGSADLGGAFDVTVLGDIDDLKIGQDLADKLLRGRTKLDLKAIRNSVGTRLDRLLIANDSLGFEGSGLLTNDGANLKFETILNQTSELSEMLKGPATVVGTANQKNGEWSVDVLASGPFGSSAKVLGLATGPNARIQFETKLPDVSSLAPNYSGPVALAGQAFMSPQGWKVDTNFSGPYNLTADVSGRVTGDAAPDIDFKANLPNVAPLVPKMDGPLSLNGSINQVTEEQWNVDVDLAGLAGTSATVKGNVIPTGNLDLTVSGTAPLALANPFVSPRTLAGDTRFDLRVNGPAKLSSISGQISTTNARAFAPTIRVALQNTRATIRLASERAFVDLQGQVSSGGTVQVSGPIGLSGSMPADLKVALNDIIFEDPSLFKTSLDGNIAVQGSLISNARISGNIDVGETLISVPTSGVSSFGTIPHISHINAPSSVRNTQSRAGLLKTSSTQGGQSGPAFPLNVTINAPQRIYVRGRGIDAELGGNLRLTGTTSNIISSGRFELVRGRLDILSKRFDLDEGIIQLRGDFDPFLRFVATTDTAVGTASVIVEGSASDPEVRFESSPESPQDEVLAQIFFGRDVSQISALQALQLASAVATLAGRGGEGIVSKLRRGFDLDDLDITTDEEGNAGLRAGKYISDNVYTDVTVGTESGPEVSLNIDLSPTIKATGKLGSDGDTSLGIYFQKDY